MSGAGPVGTASGAGSAALPPPPAFDGSPARVAATALWAFMGVAGTLFGLFLLAYAMRMVDAPDWSPIALPLQLWLSSALLLCGSLLLQRAAGAALAPQRAAARRWLHAAGAAAVGFVASQLWAWGALLEARVALAANPAASFFYLLTALHGLHVLGGLVAWSLAAARLAAPACDLRDAAWRIGLCARYWHFLLALWLLLFAALGGLSPELVRTLCGLPA